MHSRAMALLCAFTSSIVFFAVAAATLAHYGLLDMAQGVGLVPGGLALRTSQP